ncbi:MAG: lantibiotic dehydratase [Mucilaginibacter sp.]|jgi:thiopeptide-type bacteriocin biosynthesis protein|uniref:lantibiotic dehydratase n=1 Tax=Mucilaginibacter sp. TaxID=1882438 RepID=UPI003563DC7D
MQYICTGNNAKNPTLTDITMPELQFLPGLIFRSPILSLSDYQPENLDHILSDETFRAALYLASPAFFRALEKKGFAAALLSPGELITVRKYYNRMSFRCTPFGLMSAFGLTSWQHYKTHLRFRTPEAALSLYADQLVLHKIATSMDPDASELTLNPTLYAAGKDYRYINSTWDESSGKVQYQLLAVENSAVLEKVIARLSDSPQNPSFIREVITAHSGCTEQEAKTFLNFLTAQQVLVKRQQPSTLGQDYLLRLAQEVTNPDAAIRSRIQRINTAVQSVKSADVAGIINAAALLAVELREDHLAAPGNLIYGAAVAEAEGGIDARHQKHLKEAVLLLQKLAPDKVPTSLPAFAKAFTEKFDRQAIPLLQALDPETGVGYGSGSQITGDNDLLEGVDFRPPGSDLSAKPAWTDTHLLFMQKWTGTGAADRELALTDEDLDQLQHLHPLPLPASLAVMFSFCNEGLIIEAAGGCSALPLISRFSLFSTDIHDAVQDLARIEQARNPDLLLAEINFLGDTHTDNINRRLKSYDFAININLADPVCGVQTIPLSDLYVMVLNQEVVLYSSALKKRIIPRLSTAFNYHHNRLSLVNFLGDLQHQGHQTSLTLDLPSLFPGMPYYPRVSYKGTILSLGTWYLTAAVVGELTAGEEQKALQQLAACRKRGRWPRHIALSEGDRQLVFDMDTPAEQRFFLNCLKAVKGKVIIKEYLKADDALFANSENKAVAAQFVALMYDDGPVRVQPQVSLPAGGEKKSARYFAPGSKWLYLKIFCAPSLVNPLLTKDLYGIISREFAGDILQWFFVRYNEGGSHLRIRFKLRDSRRYSIVLSALNKRLNPRIIRHMIQDVQTAIYQRETERYGKGMIAAAEKSFHFSSCLVVAFLKRTNDAHRTDYHLFALSTAHSIADNFYPTWFEKLELTRMVTSRLLSENGNSKALKFSLKQKYRQMRAEMQQHIVNPEGFYQRLKITAEKQHFDNNHRKLLIQTKKMSPADQKKFIADLIHMHLNRLFTSHARKQELVIYFLLHEMYTSMNAQAGGSKRATSA